MVMTKVTAAPIPSAESMRLETPRKGQIPKNRAISIIYTNLAVTNIEI